MQKCYNFFIIYLTKRDTDMIYCIIIGILIFLAILLIFVFPYFTYFLAFRRKKENKDPYANMDSKFFKNYADLIKKGIDRLTSTPHTEVETRSFDGLTLRAHYYHSNDGAPVWIAIHGYRSNPFKDMSCGACIALDRGDNVLLINQRASIFSDGKTITFGELERLDVMEWVSYARRELGADEIILCGVSMGGGTVLSASSLPLGDEVKCIIADCPFSTTKDIISRVAKSMGYPPKISYPFVKLGAKLYGKFTPDAHSPKDAVAEANYPILLIHGEDDSFVPLQMSLEIEKNIRSEHELHTFPGADHGASCATDGERYVNIVNTFVSKYVNIKRNT